jgi:alpha-L-fucosidase 2
MENIGIPEWNYHWVYDQWKNNNYKEVQDKFDAPYDRLPAPSKIPAAALEFDISDMGPVTRVWLDISKAVCHVSWKNGVRLDLFSDAAGGAGWYKFSGGSAPSPLIIPPAYKKAEQEEKPAGVISYDLERLGYEQGRVTVGENSARYLQEGWGGFSYSVDLAWRQGRKSAEGRWRISTFTSDGRTSESLAGTKAPAAGDYQAALRRHTDWWRNFWSASSVNLPDTILERQWYLEMYKFGSAARADAPPISLQAVWTADNGQLPPWKGDFHHDLNTELSYWPAYSSNHTDLAEGFTNWLWNRRETFRKYTGEYFRTEGINVPGVTTLAGEPMGGWIQYSFGPTVSAWLAHHFYLQWLYTADSVFLKERAYPWIKEVAVFLDQFSVRGDNGQRKFLISSSPEFNDNSRDAWFGEMTNFDLALTRWSFEKAAELASVLGLQDERNRWLGVLSEWPQLAVDEGSGLMIAPGYPYAESHRHFSHLMSVYPLGLLDVSLSDNDSVIIENSLRNLKMQGSDFWTGYSYSWLGCLYARAGKGGEAAEALRIFAECFCLPNSFHVNGDQSGTGRSRMTYRPFTLEGNFAFAAAVQEMLLQYHRGTIEVFPAIPPDWEDVSFEKLRAPGAVLVSAKMRGGVVTEMTLFAEKGGDICLKNPFGNRGFSSTVRYKETSAGYMFNVKPGDEIFLSAEVK